MTAGVPVRASLAAAFVVAAVGWAAWLAWLPARLDRAPASPALSSLAALTYRAAGVACHQDPARSFRHGSWPWAVCARCAGLYGGSAIGAIVALAWGLRPGGRRGFPPLDRGRARNGLLLAAVPTAALWGIERLAGVPVSGLARYAAAVPLGAVVSALITLVIGGSVLADSPVRTGVH
jgi:hypothetical protein